MPQINHDMISIRALNLLGSRAELANLPEGKLLINTINAYSYNNARRDELFEEALMEGDVLLPDGFSIVKACGFLHYTRTKPKQRIAGWDLFEYEMNRLHTMAQKKKFVPHESTPRRKRPVVMFMGSSPKVLSLIVKNAAKKFPALDVITYSPPYKTHFTVAENKSIVQAINYANPDLLWIGMTAPKQEKWTYAHWEQLDIHCHCGTIGAVFDFFAGTSKRAPERWQEMGFEWLYRLMKEPRRMWRRYIIGNAEFLSLVMREKLGF